MPPPGRRGPPGPNHRPTRSQEEALRARKMQGKGPSDEKRSPSRRRDARPRRNSESSILDIEKPLTEEEKKAKEERRRERERRYRENKDKKPTNRKLDIIDQLDATSIYGTGRTPNPFLFSFYTFFLSCLDVHTLLFWLLNHANMANSIPPRRTVRCAQSPSQPKGQPPGAYASVSQRFAQQRAWRCRAVERAA